MASSVVPAPGDPLLVGITGIHGVGKSTLADNLSAWLSARSIPVAQASLAGPMKDALQRWGVPRDALYGPSSCRAAPCGLPGIDLSTRDLLERFGAAVRDHVDPSFWVACIAHTIARTQSQFLPPRVIIIPDVRYPNEVEWLRSQSGILLWLDWAAPARPALLPSDEPLHGGPVSWLTQHDYRAVYQRTAAPDAARHVCQSGAAVACERARGVIEPLLVQRNLKGD